MTTQKPQTTYLKDYSPTPFLIESVDLHFCLNDQETIVKSTLNFITNPKVKPTANANQTLELHGEELILKSIIKDSKPLSESDYEVSATSLIISNISTANFTLQIETKIFPQNNNSLEGLYISNGMFCTQCEPEGFRKITYYLDRPDVLAKFITTVEASKEKFPVLLSNGNPIASGELDQGRHWVKWEDPFPKPSYLFALVAGQLSCIKDQYTTTSGRKVDLHFYVEPKDSEKCGYGILALKKAMKWDEDTFGLEYDLDLYMIVAVHHFNMGAMENKGLNLFNTKYVLSSGRGATDVDLENIDGVIGHEYFHNWTGNRVTCRDWFQLSLKEGLTVFRDQEFVADLTSKGVKRIEDVNALRTSQFSEDSSPLAHPVRPESFMEINNFYTATVYSKGAEVVRMIRTLTGINGFRAGMDLYFKKYDGQAVTTDDFVATMEEANDLDLTQFRLWYSQAGTPQIKATTNYDDIKKTLTLELEQSALPDHQSNQPMYIPIKMGLLSQSGEDIPLNCSDIVASPDNDLIILNQAKQSFEFQFVPEKPLLSLLRHFTAPVSINFARPMEDWASLFQYDTDPFSRWEAGLELKSHFILSGANSILQGNLNSNMEAPLPQIMHQAYQGILNENMDDKKYLSWLLDLPEPNYLMEKMKLIDVTALFASWVNMRQSLATLFQDEFVTCYRSANEQAGNTSAEQQQELSTGQKGGARRLKNILLRYLGFLKSKNVVQLIHNQYEFATNMTDQIGALIPIINNELPMKSESLGSFYKQWSDDPLVIDKWFAIQASSLSLQGVNEIESLLQHPDFSMKVPNRMRSVIGAFAFNNPSKFHHAAGQGYEFITDQILHLDKFNPQMASYLMGSLASWQKFTPDTSDRMKNQLERILRTDGLSKGTYDKASRSLS